MKTTIKKTRLITFTNHLGKDDLKQYEKICENLGYTYAYILHDDEQENHKHYHFVVKSSSPLSANSWAERFGKASNQIEIVRSEKAIVQYLTHANDDNKIRYDYQNIITNNVAWVEKQFTNNRDIEDCEILERLYMSTSRLNQIAQVRQMLLEGVSLQKIKTAQQVIYYINANSKNQRDEQ